MNQTDASESWSPKGFRFVISAFAILAAFIYGTGFLCVYTFLERLGIRDVSGDFFKGKYIHVGILFLFFPISIVCPIVFAILIWRDQKKMRLSGNDIARIPLSSYVLLFNLVWVLYLYALFLPPSFKNSTQADIGALLIIAVSLVGPFLIRLTNVFIADRYQEVGSRILRWMLAIVIVVYLDLCTFSGFWQHLRIILFGNKGGPPTGAFYYIMFMLLIPGLIFSTNARRRRFRDKAFGAFSMGEVMHLDAFIKRLCENPDRVSIFILNAMHEKARSDLALYLVAKTQRSQIHATVVKELNRIISGASLYEENQFKAVQLRPEVDILKKETLVGRDLLRFNRLLLEDAFPIELPRHELKTSVAARGIRELEINTVCLCLVFYFLGTVAFAIKVYPYIPVANGGGSFVESPTITIKFLDGLQNTLDKMDDGNGSNAFVILEQTPTSLFVASTTNAGGPENWQKMRVLPDIIEVDRRSISEVTYHQRREVDKSHGESLLDWLAFWKEKRPD